MDTGTLILILSFGIPALVIILIFYFLKRSFSKQKQFAQELQKRKNEANSANAKVISASHGLQGGEIKRLIFLKLEINDGFSSPYEAKVGWFIDTLHFDKIKEGSFIPVKVDSANKYAIFPDISWAVYTEGYSTELSVENLEKKRIG
ncbi:MAG: hypothetical protein EHM58_18640 [Ignavibacteriae bacterium]|nr:MAG: hypothetical protein EHM58_18640 [Ignavibacteriota bacterium]